MPTVRPLQKVGRRKTPTNSPWSVHKANINRMNLLAGLELKAQILNSSTSEKG